MTTLLHNKQQRVLEPKPHRRHRQPCRPTLQVRLTTSKFLFLRTTFYADALSVARNRTSHANASPSSKGKSKAKVDHPMDEDEDEEEEEGGSDEEEDDDEVRNTPRVLSPRLSP